MSLKKEVRAYNSSGVNVGGELLNVEIDSYRYVRNEEYYYYLLSVLLL